MGLSVDCSRRKNGLVRAGNKEFNWFKFKNYERLKEKINNEFFISMLDLENLRESSRFSRLL